MEKNFTGSWSWRCLACQAPPGGVYNPTVNCDILVTGLVTTIIVQVGGDGGGRCGGKRGGVKGERGKGEEGEGGVVSIR